MKQTKTTLILGVLLAIIVVVLIVFEINTLTQPIEPQHTEESVVLPIAKKSLSLLKEIISLGIAK